MKTFRSAETSSVSNVAPIFNTAQRNPKNIFQIPSLLSHQSLSLRVFVSLLLCVMGLSYAVLLWSIWLDTGMSVSGIAEAYQTFETMELVEHTFKYLPWFVMTFGVTVPLFCFTSFQRIPKEMFAFAVPVFILLDFGSMWLIRFHSFFAWSLFVSGFTLAASFLVLFSLIQYDLWWHKR